jgi:hypothetical protein
MLAVQLVVPVAVPLPPRLFAHLTCVTRILSAAVPRSVRTDVLVRYVELVVGEVIVMVGGRGMNRVTVTLSVRVLPDAVRPVTVSTFVPTCRAIPLAVQLVVPLAVPLPPRSFAQRTCVTPALLDTVPLSVSEVSFVLYVPFEVGEVIVRAEEVVVPRVTVKVSVAVLPAASRAVMVSTFVPVCRATPLAVQLVVPVAVPLPPRLFAHRTWVTPTLSAAVPASVREDAVVL